MIALDLTGKTFGRLTVIRRNGSAKNRKAAWSCQCGCGNTSIVLSGSLQSGHTKSCGCLQGSAHGLTKHPLYSIWGAMRKRCSPRGDPQQAHRYYGRGIRVCTEWQTDFKAFFAWATSHGWKPGLELDRQDNDGNYRPNNCRFVTRIINGSNRGVPKNNTSGYTGVHRCSQTNTWEARITVNKICKHLGVYPTKELALFKRNEFIVENNLPHPIQTFRLPSSE